MAYTVKLDAFEGPLDLLLHLIRRAEMDITNIEIARITDDYLAYLAEMQEEKKLEPASEFLVMAATLLALKSRALLPRKEDPAEETLRLWEEALDPRAELIRRLIEYRRFKAAAERLRERENAGALYTRPPADLAPYDRPGELPLDVSILALVIAYQTAIRRREAAATVAVVVRERLTVEAAREAVVRALAGRTEPVSFWELVRSGPVDVDPRDRAIALFLAVLELVREQRLRVLQERPFAPPLLVPEPPSGTGAGASAPGGRASSADG
ncbi:segregation/condensation protein A [Hydrogenibacillus schlegelii]|uniref:Segregation and condensation protein A n=1 Tax=Hydrogenibacillus schlegelii TaxID=1484 RepID=A0A132MFU3_HYDSH|nr:segregation/condensation protein A [Hydrogenibacillus schlegelii]KWW96693.1 hypothetical protein TR75_12635 [Hydrogenibacillus schlegelii]OAR05315.1 hypothetical protein SA87_08080 [Hydrogenibacillus schlegelii]